MNESTEVILKKTERDARTAAVVILDAKVAGELKSQLEAMLPCSVMKMMMAEFAGWSSGVGLSTESTSSVVTNLH